jgi:hypothetical protein
MLSKKNLNIEGDQRAGVRHMDGRRRSQYCLLCAILARRPVKERGFTNSSYGHRNLTQDVRDLLTPGRCEQP